MILAKTSSAVVHAIGGAALTVNGATVKLGGTGGDQVYDDASVLVNSGTFDTSGRSEALNTLSSAGTIDNTGGGASILTIGQTGGGSSMTGVVQNSSGTLAIIKQGTGTMVLSGANTYSGGTTINQGTVSASGTALGTGAVSVGASGTLACTGGTGLTAQYVNATPVAASFASLSALTAHFSTQTVALATTATTMNAGASGSAFPAPYNSAATNFEALYTGRITIGTAGIYTFNTTSDDGSVLFVDGVLVVNNNAFQNVTTRTGTISLASGAHDLVVGFYQGTVTYGLNAQISGAGNTTMVDISTANATLASDMEVSALSGAGTVTLGGVNLTLGRSNSSTTFSGVISGSGGIQKIGTGTLTLTGANSYAGATSIAAGTVQVGSGGTTGTLGAGLVYDAGALVFARSDALTAANGISGTGSVTVNGGGALTLTGASSYTGATSIAQGTVNAGGSALGKNAVTVAAGATLAVTGSTGLSARYFSVAPTTTNFAALLTLQTHLGSQTLALANTAATMNFASNGSLFPNPFTSTNAAFEAIYSGKLTIGAAGTYTFNTGSDDGSMLFVDGAVVVNNNFVQGFLSRTGAVALTSGPHDLAIAFYNNGGGLGLNAQISGAGNTTMVDISTANATLTPDLVIGSLAGAGTVALTDGSLVTGFDGTSSTFSGVIAGANGLLKRGAGTLTLSGASSWSGATTLTNGTLKLASTASLGNTAITVANAATLAVTPGSGTVAIGTTGAGSAGATLNLNSGAIYDQTDAAIGTGAVQENASFAGTALTISGATVNVDLGSTGVDLLSATLAAAPTGTNSIGVTGIGSNLTFGTYPIITAASGVGGGTWQFTGGGTIKRLVVGGNAYSLLLASSATTLSVTVADGVDIWNGTTSTDWNVASNWSLGVVPTATHDVQIGNGTGTFKGAPSVTGAGGTCNSILFTSAAAAVGAGGGTLTVGGGGITVAVAGSSIACPVALAANQTWATGASGLAVSGAISGAFTLGKTGSGTLTLSAASSYSGPTTISGGTVASGIDNALPTASTVLLGASDGTGSGALDLSTFNQTLGALTSQSSSATANTVNVTAGKTLTISGAGGLTVGVDTGAASTSNLTMAGGGALVVANAAANVVVGLAQASTSLADTATLDLTALASVTLGSGGTAINELRLGLRAAVRRHGAAVEHRQHHHRHHHPGRRFERPQREPVAPAAPGHRHQRHRRRHHRRSRCPRWRPAPWASPRRPPAVPAR